METFTQTLSLPIMALLLVGLIGLVWWANAEPPAPVVKAPPRKKSKQPPVLDVPAQEDSAIEVDEADEAEDVETAEEN